MDETNHSNIVSHEVTVSKQTNKETSKQKNKNELGYVNK